MREERPIRGIAFNLDGTLTDSSPGLIATLDRTLSEQGLTPGWPSVYRHLNRQRRDVLVERALRWTTQMEPDAALKRRHPPALR